MNFLTGVTSLNSMMKMSQLNMKWTERQKNLGKRQQKTQSEESPEIKRLREMAEDARRSNYVEGLKSKLKCGGLLTKDELDYLKVNHPELYQDAVESAAEREQYRRELENCRTQEEVDRLNTSRLNRYVSQAKTISANPNIPLNKKVQLLEKIMGKAMGVQNEFNQFVKRGAYDGLPSELDEDEKKNKKADGGEHPEIEQQTDTIFAEDAIAEIEGEIDNLTKGDNAGDDADVPQTTTPSGDAPAPGAKATVTTTQRKVALHSYTDPAPPAAPAASPKLPTRV